MLSKTTLSISAVLLAAAAVGTASAATPDRFMNGQSFYGQPAEADANTRVVDAASAKYVNARYGETLKFVKGNKSFAWTFDGLDNRSAELRMLAPKDFGPTPTTVYVGRNPINRR